MNEKKFLKPEVEVINFNNEDFILTSNGDIGTIGVGSIPWGDQQQG